jgi:hypothetical protein
MSAPKGPERILPKKEETLEEEKQDWTNPAIRRERIGGQVERPVHNAG